MPDPNPAAKPQLQINPEWEVHPAQLKQWLDQNQDITLVDVRQLKEWNFNHLPGALLAPLHELPAKAQSELQPLKNRRIIVYCHHGTRSLRAAAFLRQQGFPAVHSLAGGIDAWSQLIDPAIPRY